MRKKRPAYRLGGSVKYAEGGVQEPIYDGIEQDDPIGRGGYGKYRDMAIPEPTTPDENIRPIAARRTAVRPVPKDDNDDDAINRQLEHLTAASARLSEMVKGQQEPNYMPLVHMGMNMMAYRPKEGGNSALGNILQAIGASGAAVMPEMMKGKTDQQGMQLKLAHEDLQTQRAVLSSLQSDRRARMYQEGATARALAAQNASVDRRAIGDARGKIKMPDGSWAIKYDNGLMPLNEDGSLGEFIVTKEPKEGGKTGQFSPSQLAAAIAKVDADMLVRWGQRESSGNPAAWDAEKGKMLAERGILGPQRLPQAPAGGAGVEVTQPPGARPTPIPVAGAPGAPTAEPEATAPLPPTAPPLVPRDPAKLARDKAAAVSGGANDAKNWAKDYSDAQEEAQKATSDLFQYGALERNLAKLGDTDLAQNWKTTLYQVANVFGVKNEKLSATEQFNAIQQKLQRGGYTPGEGAISDYERKLFAGMFPTLTNSAEGNRAVLAHLKMMASYAVARAAKMDQIKEANPDVRPKDFAKQMASFAADYYAKNAPPLPGSLTEAQRTSAEAGRELARRKAMKIGTDT